MDELILPQLCRAVHNAAMPFSPSDLPWWGWLLCAAGGFVGGFLAFRICENVDADNAGRGVLVLSWIAAAICAAIGVIRFVKWVWAG